MRPRTCQKLWHAEMICKEKGQQQPREYQVSNKHEEEQQFVASYF